MKWIHGAWPVAAVIVVLGCAGRWNSEPGGLGWPEETNVTRPWTFWHWFGNAVDKVNITSSLEEFKRCGFGGVMVIGLQECSDPMAISIPLLSAAWADVMKHTIRKARSLGMDVDMCPTTGWEWGGPWIGRGDAGSAIRVASFRVEAGRRLTAPVYERRDDLQTVMGYSSQGSTVDLLAHVDGACVLDWMAPVGEGTWTIYSAGIARGTCGVRVPTPDGKGWVVNYLSASAVQAHLDRFSTSLAGFSAEDWPRAWFDDSWEAGMNWAQDGFAQFEKRRGYDLRQHLPELDNKGTDEKHRRVQRDFRLTAGELMIEGMFKTATRWAHAHGSRLACESIDHPGNTVDMAAACDIPNADVGGGRGWWFRNGQYVTEGNFFKRHKVQSSAAHIAGKPLVSSETMTCWGQMSGHPFGFFSTPLKDVKEKIDLDFIGGVNHLQYHSITYSPSWAQWPGYLFNAEAQMGPYNPYWPHLADLNAYVSRCQSFLQAGHPDAELMFYYPYDDLLMKGGGDHDAVCFPVAKSLFDDGYDLDYVTDHMLLDPGMVTVAGRSLASPGSRHRALVVGNCVYMDDATLQRIFDLAGAGATVVMAGDFPQDVPGLSNLAPRREKLKSLIRTFASSKVMTGTVARMDIGSGRILQGAVTRELMDAAGIRRETMVDQGLRYIRRTEDSGWIYFIVNPPGHAGVAGWVPLGVAGEDAAIFDPATGRVGMCAFSNKNGQSSVHLQLDPSGSCVVRVFKQKVKGPAWTYTASATPAIPVSGTWTVTFVSGGERMPATEQVDELSSWTTWTTSPQIDLLRYFSGIARYSIVFDKPAVMADQWILDLGEVRNSARVMLNGQCLGTVYGAPDFRVQAGRLLKDHGNLLEVEVANLAFNRVAYLDLQHIPWRMIPSLDGTAIPLITSNLAPLPSGLLGPVRLVPVVAMTPGPCP